MSPHSQITGSLIHLWGWLGGCEGHGWSSTPGIIQHLAFPESGGRGTCCCSSYCHYCCTYMAPCSRGLVLCCACRHADGQLSARCVKPKRCTGLYLSTLGLSLIGRQLMPYHCFMILFAAVGLSDITGVDIGSPANNTSVYLFLRDTGWTLPDGSMPPTMRYQSK